MNRTQAFSMGLRPVLPMLPGMAPFGAIPC